MTPSQLKTYLNRLIQQNIKISTMIWGAPGIGKSSIVAQIADNQKAISASLLRLRMKSLFFATLALFARS